MKVLGAEKFGYIGFALSVSQYLMLLVDFGFNLSATKRIALAKDNKEELNRIFSSTVYAKLGLLALSFILLIVISLIPEFAVYRTTMLVMFLVVLGQAGLFVFLFQGIGEIKWVSIFNCIAKVTVLPLTFLLVKSPDDVLIATLLQGSVAVVAMLISWGMIAKKGWVKLVSVKFSDVKKELSESFPLFLSTAATSIYTACFVLILGYFASPEEVGQYSAVDRVMRALCYLVLVPVLQVYYPKISALAKENMTLARSRVKGLFAVTLAGMFCIAVFLFFGSPIMIKFLGDDYSNSDILFKIMSFVPIFVGMGGVFGQLILLAMGNKEDKKYFSRVYIIAAVVAICSVFLLSSMYGMYGTSISLLITEVVVVFLFFNRIIRK
jgi:O-antigen/teichoic acid export membrane protein